MRVFVAAATAVLLLTVGAAAEAAAAPAAESCTGTAVGRLVLPDGSAAAGEWVQLAGKGARVAADGGFRVDGVPIGRHNGVARHARFAFVLGGCGQVVDLGAIEYPIVHPTVLPARVARTEPAAEALARFMDARIARDEPTVRAMLAGELLPRANLVDGVLFQVSNPCWYRYEVVSLIRWTGPAPGQPPPGSVDALVRIYMHTWSGDNGGLLPLSSAQAIRLVETPAGWRAGRLQVQEYRDEPGEPHGWTTSACRTGRRPPVWPAYALPAAGGLPVDALPVAAAVGLVFVGTGAVLRERRKARHGREERAITTLEGP